MIAIPFHAIRPRGCMTEEPQAGAGGLKVRVQGSERIRRLDEQRLASPGVIRNIDEALEDDQADAHVRRHGSWGGWPR